MNTKTIELPFDIGDDVYIINSMDPKEAIFTPYVARVEDITVSKKVIVKTPRGEELTFPMAQVVKKTDALHVAGQSLLHFDYWDCSCDHFYVHRRPLDPEKIDAYCPVCKTWEEDSPNSHVRELGRFEEAKKSFSVELSYNWFDVSMHGINAGAVSFARKDVWYRGEWVLFGYDFFSDKADSKEPILTEVAHYMVDMKRFVRFERPHSRAMVGLNLPVDDLGRRRERDTNKMYVSQLQPLQ